MHGGIAMSSGVDAGGGIAAAVILPAAVAYGAGWLAWQGGKLLLEVNRAADRQIAEKKQQLEAEARHRKMIAISAHSQLVEMCSRIINELETTSSTTSIASFAEIERLRYELDSICNEVLPDDTSQIENMTTIGYLKLDKIVQQKKQLATITVSDSEKGLYRGLSVADLLDDIRLVVETMKVQATKGQNVSAPNPDVLERMKLNDQFSHVTAKIMSALENVKRLSSTYGLNQSGRAWFQSCFNGIDDQIILLCQPTTSNEELKKGIVRLQEALKQYEIMAPSIEKDLEKIDALYKIYADASKALGETILDIKSFKNASELEKKLNYLQERAKRAQECAEIYKKLGAAAYICYAWDQELKAMGYEVHSRKTIIQMASSEPKRGQIGVHKLPFYNWNNSDLTQLYSISSQCSLQLIVHDDGTVSMQTIAETNSSEVIHEQHIHCEQLASLHDRLRKNWFLLYDYEETKSPDSVETVAHWRNTKISSWKKSEDVLISEQRTQSNNAEANRYLDK